MPYFKEQLYITSLSKGEYAELLERNRELAKVVTAETDPTTVFPDVGFTGDSSIRPNAALPAFTLPFRIEWVKITASNRVVVNNIPGYSESYERGIKFEVAPMKNLKEIIEFLPDFHAFDYMATDIPVHLRSNVVFYFFNRAQIRESPATTQAIAIIDMLAGITWYPKYTIGRVVPALPRAMPAIDYENISEIEKYVIYGYRASRRTGTDSSAIAGLRRRFDALVPYIRGYDGSGRSNGLSLQLSQTTSEFKLATSGAFKGQYVFDSTNRQREFPRVDLQPPVAILGGRIKASRTTQAIVTPVQTLGFHAIDVWQDIVDFVSGVSANPGHADWTEPTGITLAVAVRVRINRFKGYTLLSNSWYTYEDRTILPVSAFLESRFTGSGATYRRSHVTYRSDNVAVWNGHNPLPDDKIKVGTKIRFTFTVKNSDVQKISFTLEVLNLYNPGELYGHNAAPTSVRNVRGFIYVDFKSGSENMTLHFDNMLTGEKFSDFDLIMQITFVPEDAEDSN